MRRPPCVSDPSPEHSNSASATYFKTSNLPLLTHPVLNLFFSNPSCVIMRTSVLISLLLLSILVHEAQGMRLVKGSLSAKLHKIHEDILSGLRRSIDVIGLEKPNLCTGNHCLESGRNRKLMMTKSTSSTSSTTTNSKNAKNDHGNKKADSIPEGQSSLGGKEENFSVNPSPLSEQPENVSHDHSPDILDLAGMDYSPATRKPPIHN